MSLSISKFSLMIAAIVASSVAISVSAANGAPVKSQSAPAWSSSDPMQFGASDSWTVGKNGSYAGMQSWSTGVDNASPDTGATFMTGPGGTPLTATIMAGLNSGTFSGGTSDVTAAWRTPTPAELAAAVAPDSNVVRFLGMGSGSGEPIQTDPFVLQMTFNAANIPASGAYLGWLDPNGPGGQPIWENAVLGNFRNNATPQEEGVVGSFATFQSTIGDTNIADYIGAWGYDPTGGDVWAVVNHNSEFAVVPEPSTIALAAMALLGTVALRRKRRTPV